MSRLHRADSLGGDLRSGRLWAVPRPHRLYAESFSLASSLGSGTPPAPAARSVPGAWPPGQPPQPWQSHCSAAQRSGGTRRRPPPPPPGPFPYFPGPQAPPRRRDQNTCRVPPCPITPRPGSDHAARRGADWPAANWPGADWLSPERPRPSGAGRVLVRLRAPPPRRSSPGPGPAPPAPRGPRQGRAARAGGGAR